MVALSAAAAAARAESRRLRADAMALRLVARRSLREARRGVAACSRAAERSRRLLVAGSPWSDLPWRGPEGELDDVLVPLDP